MKKAIKIVEKRVSNLELFIESIEKDSKDSVFTLTNMDVYVKLNEAQFLLKTLKDEYDKTRSKSRAIRHSKLPSGETQGS